MIAALAATCAVLRGTRADACRRLGESAVDAVAVVLADAGVNGNDPRLRARVAVVIIESLVHHLVAQRAPTDPQTVIDETTKLVVDYSRG